MCIFRAFKVQFETSALKFIVVFWYNVVTTNRREDIYVIESYITIIYEYGERQYSLVRKT